MKNIRILFAIFLSASFRLFAANLPAGWVVGWGDNGYGGVTGVPFFGYTNGVVTIAGQILTNAVAVSAGRAHGLAIRSDSTVVGWGLNNQGQATGVPTTEYASGVVMLDGQILSNVVAIAAGFDSSLALKSDGTVAAWGTIPNNSKMHVAAGLSNVVYIADELIGLLIKRDGTVVGLDNQSIDSLSNSVAITIKSERGGGNVVRVAALKNDGTVVELVLGYKDPPVPVGVSNVVAIAAGGGLSRLALKRDSTVFAWGYGSDMPAGLSNIVAIAAGQSHCLALKNDGTVIAWGSIGFQPATPPAGLSNVIAIAAGDGFSLAITTNRAVADKFRY